MNQPQQTGAAPAAATPESAPVVTPYEDRAAAAFSESAADPASPLAPADGSAADSGEAAKRAERRKELDAVLSKERERVDYQAKLRAAEQAQQRAEAAERRAAELESQLTGRVDPTTLDAPGFFALAKRMQVTPAELGKWLRDQEANPELIAQHVAQKTIDPKVSALEKRLADQDAIIARITGDLQQEKQVAQAMERGSAMLHFTERAAAQAPHSSAFLKSFGPEEFLKLANSASPTVPSGPGWEQHVLDSVEDMLTHLGKIYGQPQAAAPQQRQAPTPPHPGAAKPMSTVSNTLAQGRASVVSDDTDWAALPFEERARRVFE